MDVKIKKQNSDGIVRLESCGEVKEIIINEDFLHPKKASVAICFRGKNTSGIVQLTPQEIEFLYKQVAPKMHLLQEIKVMKFKKS